MSQPEEEIESEIEEGEIVSVTDEDEDEEEIDDEELFVDEGVDIAELLTNLMATSEGDTVCTALVNIGLQMQTQNKILIKILSKLQKA
jgi:hypothetical protein